jgi:hypothetical protein
MNAPYRDWTIVQSCPHNTVPLYSVSSVTSREGLLISSFISPCSSRSPLCFRTRSLSNANTSSRSQNERNKYCLRVVVTQIALGMTKAVFSLLRSIIWEYGIRICRSANRTNDQMNDGRQKENREAVKLHN